MKKILITGGPVHAYLDAVKLITNRFKGGLMFDLGNMFLDKYWPDVEVTFLGSKLIEYAIGRTGFNFIKHDGFDDYRKQVLELAPKHDAVILGAAVANLIPLTPFKGKFPSHNYKIGDVIPINFTIAPRIINMVKHVAPKTQLFGFKLLSDVPEEELIRAAYEVLLDSHATAVFANDAKDLIKKFIVTKERGVHLTKHDEIAQFVWESLHDRYYHTTLYRWDTLDIKDELAEFAKLKDMFRDDFPPTPEGYVFGTIAVRSKDGFLTTGRGKKELDDVVYVRGVDHVNRNVHTVDHKATLNAPLLDWIFKRLRQVKHIVHLHKQISTFPTLPYAPPGTVRDTDREITTSFNIKNHGCFMLYDERGMRV